MSQNSQQDDTQDGNDVRNTESKMESGSKADSELETEGTSKYNCRLRDSVYEKLYRDREETGDVCFKRWAWRGRYITYAHKSILAAGSPIFDKMFYDSEATRIVTDIQCSKDSSALEIFLKCFYMDNVVCEPGDVPAVLELAQEYEVPQCVEMCLNVLKRNASSCDDIFEYYESAIEAKQPEIIRLYKDYISTDAKVIFDKYLDELLYLNRDMLKRILQLDLQCDETVVFDACLKWARGKYRKRLAEKNGRKLREELGDCLYLIRFNRLTVKQFTERIVDEQNDGLLTAAELEDIIYSITNKEYKSTMFRQ